MPIDKILIKAYKVIEEPVAQIAKLTILSCQTCFGI